MKKMIMLYGIISLVFALCAEPKRNADAYFKATDNVPKYGGGGWYNGILSVTNTGEVAFSVVTDREWAGETIRFYQEGTKEEPRAFENTHGWGREIRAQERKEALDGFDIWLGKNKAVTTLQPSESVSFECRGCFKLQHGAPGGFYKAEMYLGHNTWVPVHITPTLGTLYAVAFEKGAPIGDFYYSQMGTNQYLYVKTDDGKFKQASEMKLGSRPEKLKDEDAVTFVSPDGATKKLTRDQARQVVREREQENQQE